MTTTSMQALDLFAGTGWGVACQRLGIPELGVEIMPEAVATRTAAGMQTVYRDVWEGLDGTAEVPEHDLLIASPPCQTFSMAGRGAGRAALDEVRALVRSLATTEASVSFLRNYAALGDPRTVLIVTPLVYVQRHRPRFVVLEQVPTCLPVWEAYAEVLRGWGYSAAVGVLNAEQYGVPQTRKRAILVARRDGVEAQLPAPSHSRYYPRDWQRFDEGVRPWVSMAEALGWGMTARPYPTVATGTEAGGTDPAALGGSGARRLVYGERSRGAWRPSGDADNDGGILRLSDRDAAVLQSFPPYELRPEIEAWEWRDHPATTIQGDPRLAQRGHHERQMNGALRLEPEEASALQSFEPDFPFQGNRGRRFLQIGNAVPPLLAQAVLSTLLP